MDIPAAEMAAHYLLADAVELRRLPVAEIADERSIITEAREVLNDILARIDRHNARQDQMEIAHV